MASRNKTWDDGFFREQMAKVLKLTSKSVTQEVNNRLFSVARASLWETQKADVRDISRDLGKISKLGRKGGRMRFRHTLRKAKTHSSAPLAALIINKRAKPGQGLQGGPEMRQKIHQLIAARNRSVAYIKSGWLYALQYLTKFSDIKNRNENRPKKDLESSQVKQYGKQKGNAIAAKDVNGKMLGAIMNSAFAEKQWSSKTQNKQSIFRKVGGKGLQAGFDKEAIWMKPYIERKLKEEFERINRAQR